MGLRAFSGWKSYLLSFPQVFRLIPMRTLASSVAPENIMTSDMKNNRVVLILYFGVTRGERNLLGTIVSKAFETFKSATLSIIFSDRSGHSHLPMVVIKKSRKIKIYLDFTKTLVPLVQRPVPGSSGFGVQAKPDIRVLYRI